MVLFARALYQAFPHAVDEWRQVIIAIAAIRVLVGAFAGLVQKNLKRLLAYSSIANMGYALIGLSAGNAEGAQAMLVFMTLYMIDTTGFFAALTSLQRSGKPMEQLSDFAGLAKVNRPMALVLTVLAFSVMGIPPLPGFWGKFYVFKAAIDAGQWPVAVLGLVSSVVAAFYYLRLIKVMWLDEAPSKTDPMPKDSSGIAYLCALFAFPGVMIALTWIDPAAQAAAQAFGL
jgi:NADH-quinone oxidoreductase subunit N